MAHLVKPRGFRVGKTYLWPFNTVVKKVLSADTTNIGINRAASKLLKRKRMFLVGGVVLGLRSDSLCYRLLFSPKIKVKPREHKLGAFIRRVTYRKINWRTESLRVRSYVHRRREKVAKLARRKSPQINKWLTKRMFRGAGKFIWKKPRRFRAISLPSFSRLPLARIAVRSALCNPASLVKARIKNKPRTSRKKIKKVHRRLKSWIHRYRRWKFDRIKRRRFNSRNFSRRLSITLRRKIKVSALNLFSYLVQKNLIAYKTHQRHLWNYTYRRYRFHYKNYFDIVNAIFILSRLDGCEGFLLAVLRVTLPLILKIRKFFKFLNAVIQNMPELREKFSVFKVAIAGKLAVGTKRTKAHSIGYGVLAAQTLALDVTNNFLSYPHIYG